MSVSQLPFPRPGFCAFWRTGTDFALVVLHLMARDTGLDDGSQESVCVGGADCPLSSLSGNLCGEIDVVLVVTAAKLGHLTQTLRISHVRWPSKAVGDGGNVFVLASSRDFTVCELWKRPCFKACSLDRRPWKAIVHRFYATNGFIEYLGSDLAARQVTRPRNRSPRHRRKWEAR